MSDYDDFKEAFKATFSGVADIAKDLAASAGDKAKSLGRIAKLTVELNSERENAKKAYAEIGKLYYETYRNAPGEFFIQLCDEVTLVNQNISRMEDELAALKASVSESGTGSSTGASGSDSFEHVVEADEAASAPADDDIEVEITEEKPDEPEKDQ